MPILMHALGLVGMAGVLLLPMRAWSLVARREVGGKPIAPGAPAIAAVVVSVAIAWSLYMAEETMPVVFGCLYASRCTATLSGGLLNLALFGFSVLVVELCWQVSRLVLARRRAAT